MGTFVTRSGDYAHMNPTVIKWQTWQRGRGLSERTIADRTLTVERMTRESGLASPELLTEDVVLAWFDRPMHPNTRATYRSHIRAWSSWQVLNGLPDITARLGSVKTLRTRPRPISTEHLRALLALPLRRRTRMMVILAAYQGLRVHEIAKFRGDDIDALDKTVHVIGKGQVEEWLPLHPLVGDVLADWPRRGFWFPSYAGHGREGQCIQPDAVSQAIRDALARTGSRATAHQLRHWFATELVRSGADVFTTQRLMRHESAATTAIYALVADDRATDAIARLPRVA